MMWAISGEPLMRHRFEHNGERRQAALDQVRRRRRLEDARPALWAGVAGADRDQHAILRRHDVEPVRAVLADPDHLAAAAGAEPRLRFDDPLDARQVGRQRAMRLRPLGRLRRRRVGRGTLLVSFASAMAVSLDHCS
jgi:hypothetical protein